MNKKVVGYAQNKLVGYYEGHKMTLNGHISNTNIESGAEFVAVGKNVYNELFTKEAQY